MGSRGALGRLGSGHGADASSFVSRLAEGRRTRRTVCQLLDSFPFSLSFSFLLSPFYPFHPFKILFILLKPFFEDLFSKSRRFTFLSRDAVDLRSEESGVQTSGKEETDILRIAQIRSLERFSEAFEAG